MVISGDTSEAKVIVDNINTILKTQDKSETKMNVDYLWFDTSGEAKTT